MALLCFWPKKVLLWPSNEKFSCSCTGSHHTIFRLSSEKIFDLLTHLWPFQIWLEMKTKVQNWTKMLICYRTINHKKNWNVPLDALMCPLQIINDIEALSLTLHGVNTHFIHHPSNVEKYSIWHKSVTDLPKQKRNGSLENIFLHLYTGFGVKIQNTNGRKSSLNFFDMCKIDT